MADDLDRWVLHTNVLPPVDGEIKTVLVTRLPEVEQVHMGGMTMRDAAVFWLDELERIPDIDGRRTYRLPPGHLRAEELFTIIRGAGHGDQDHDPEGSRRQPPEDQGPAADRAS